MTNLTIAKDANQGESEQKNQKNQRKKVAVVGSGISGISAAWFLSQEHDVTLFEKNEKLGGHTNTTTLDLDGKSQPVDTGFIVFNTPNYPNLTAMFKHLQVKTQETEMSFSVTANQGELEYSGNNINTLFAQRRNLFSVAHWKMIGEILRFNKQAKQDLEVNHFGTDAPLTLSLGDYLDNHGFSQRMRDYYLLPMAAAIWSCPLETMMKFPVGSFLQFFENHGLLNIEDRPQWESVVNGSEQYIKAIMANEPFAVQLSSPVTNVYKTDFGMAVCTPKGQEMVFDDVVFASHADETYQILDDDLKTDFELLSNFKYQENIAYLHSDLKLMPKRKLAWAAWNYLRDTHSEESPVAVTYWMNLLQNFKTKTPLLVTLNPSQPPQKSLTHQRIVYQHPVFDSDAMTSQKYLSDIQGKHNLWFCGSYFGYGFHEDGLTSSVNLAKLWNIDLPWDKKASTKQTPEKPLENLSEDDLKPSEQSNQASQSNQSSAQDQKNA
ncbi:NAD(P)/FAD-dependent oxidoreductase [Thiomicrorhabdus sp. Milos-T2]|uniref:NAD(P)/FAD-dependent oxidoreductase n=1 Tax=Thiomicrorhabdus sp. Milos-T2 TaxID=90814 RepID=UPI000A007FFA|nr:FAD-dependent oxidoreductase [Thiomicrorhabdus sp. Milos-T2]